jgi:hypothetical protein
MLYSDISTPLDLRDLRGYVALQACQELANQRFAPVIRGSEV